MATRTVEHVLIDIEDQKRQLYHRLDVCGVTVLVDGTPEDDPLIGQVIDLIGGALDLRAALKAMVKEFDEWAGPEEDESRGSPAPAKARNMRVRIYEAAEAALAKATKD